MPPQLTRYLSKSQFTRGLQCLKSLYLYRKRRDLQDAVSPEQQAIFDAGTEVGVLAQKWIGGGVLITAGHMDPQKALDETQAAIDAGAQVIYEAAFLYEDVLIRADIIARNPEKNWDLFEVKSTTGVEPTHLNDVAIQRYVITGAGIKLNASHLVHLDPGYVRYGALDLQKLFLAVDVTAETEPLLDMIYDQLRAMKAMAEKPDAPEREIGQQCTKPYDCSFIGHCWAHVPEYSVFNLAGARMDKKTSLWRKGIVNIKDIPDFDKKDSDTKEYKLTEYQNTQRLVARTNKPYIDSDAIRMLLANLYYPHYFLDFEAVNPAIPPYDGLRPYQQLPFEASLHVRRERAAPLEHFEYLADGTKDPRPELVSFLRRHIDTAGSVIAYNKSYEGGIIKALAAFTHNGEPLLQIEQRLWDLADAFRKGLWAEPKFLGSWSIKKVLPVLVPDMTYDGMFIADGVAAMQAYAKLMDPATTPAERAGIMTALRIYCGQDTLAMVRILDVVQEAVYAKEVA